MSGFVSISMQNSIKNMFKKKDGNSSDFQNTAFLFPWRDYLDAQL